MGSWELRFGSLPSLIALSRLLLLKLLLSARVMLLRLTDELKVEGA